MSLADTARPEDKCMPLTASRGAFPDAIEDLPGEVLALHEDPLERFRRHQARGKPGEKGALLIHAARLWERVVCRKDRSGFSGTIRQSGLSVRFCEVNVLCFEVALDAQPGACSVIDQLDRPFCLLQLKKPLLCAFHLRSQL